MEIICAPGSVPSFGAAEKPFLRHYTIYIQVHLAAFPGDKAFSGELKYHAAPLPSFPLSLKHGQVPHQEGLGSIELMDGGGCLL